MTGVSSPSSLIPEARDDDDDDVAWALQTAAVQWKRGGRTEAVGWLRRAAEAAVEAGAYARARELNGAAVSLEHAARLVGDEDGEDYDGAEPILEVSGEIIEEFSDDDEEVDDGRPELLTLDDEGPERVAPRPVPRALPPPVRVLRPPPKAGVSPPWRPSGPLRSFDDSLPPVFPPVVSRGASALPPSSRGPDLVGLEESVSSDLGLPELPSRPSARGLAPPVRPSVPEPPYDRTSSPSVASRTRGAPPLPRVPPPPSSRSSVGAPEPRSGPSLTAELADEPAEPESTTGSGRGHRRAVWSFVPEVEPAEPPSEPASRLAPTRSRPTWSFAPVESEPAPPQSEPPGPIRAEPGWAVPSRNDYVSAESEPPPESFRGTEIPASASDSFAPAESLPPERPSEPIPVLLELAGPAVAALAAEPRHSAAPYRDKAPSAEELDLADAEELPIVEAEDYADGQAGGLAMLGEVGRSSATVTSSGSGAALAGYDTSEPPAPEPTSLSDEPTVPRDSSLRGVVLATLAEASGTPTLDSATLRADPRRSPELRAQLLCPRVPELENRHTAVSPAMGSSASAVDVPEPGREPKPSGALFPESLELTSEKPPQSTQRGPEPRLERPSEPEVPTLERSLRPWPVPFEPPSAAGTETARSPMRAATPQAGVTESIPPASHGSEAPTAIGAGRAPSQRFREMGEPSVGGIRLADVRGLQDLPEDAQMRLAATARVETLAEGEEVGFFAVALVLEGWFRIMPAVTDTACARAKAGDVVFTTGTIEEGLDLCVRAAEDASTVAVWDRASLEQATADCPWVADELRLVADGFQALAGAAMGRLGDRLDESLRSMVTDRCEVRTLRPGEIVAAQGQRVPGMHIVGAGRLELVGEDGTLQSEVGPGEFLFAAQVLTAGLAPKTARAGSQGALVLVAERKVAHELVTSVPPLLELLAEE